MLDPFTNDSGNLTMQSKDFSVRALAVALAAVIVTGAVAALGSTSNANFRAAVAAVEQRYDVAPTQVAFEPSRINVVGVRATRTAAHVDERSRPQS